MEIKGTDSEEVVEVTVSQPENESPPEDHRELWVVGIFITIFFVFIFILAQFF